MVRKNCFTFKNVYYQVKKTSQGLDIMYQHNKYERNHHAIYIYIYIGFIISSKNMHILYFLIITF